jgi:Arylsulfotransferase (ASST)
MKRLVLAALAAAMPVAVHAVPSVYPTGVTIYDPALAYNSYVVFGGTDHKTHLIDMNGNEVHRWDFAGFPSELLDPAVTGRKLGHVLVQLATDERAGAGVVPNMPAEFRNRTIGELDWDGKTVWEWGEQAPGGAARQHHDWFRLANGNTLILANSLHPIEGFKLPKILDDVIYEVTPQGKIVWQWAASDHIGEIFNAAELALVHNPASPDYLHFNDMTPLGPNKWFDAGDKRFDPDNILVDSRNANFIAIIDKKTGKIVWQLGPDYPHVPPGTPLPHAVDQISGQHDAHLIEPGLPGAGNLIVFDNQGEGGYPPAPLGVNSGSRVLEIDPVKKQIVWQYTAENSGRPGWTFYSSFISSARRLPNGNTLIDEGMNGRFFQVTPAGKIVWEYVSPYYATSPVGATSSTPVLTNWVYRAQPVPYDWVPAGTPRSEAPLAK